MLPSSDCICVLLRCLLYGTIVSVPSLHRESTNSLIAYGSVERTLLSFYSSQTNVRSAERLREMCSRNGGMFIKVGQHVGSMDYLLPQEYVQTFKVFHSNAPQTPLHRMKMVIKEELGHSGRQAPTWCRPSSLTASLLHSAEEVFAELSEEPLGAASLAQCHRGVLKDGRVVAVKIQHPDVLANAYTDMDTMDVSLFCL